MEQKAAGPDIELIESDETWKEFCFRARIEAYREIVTRNWGWNDKIQREFCERDWQVNPPQVILCGREPVGTIGLGGDDNCIEISQFCILPEHQGKGTGTSVLRRVLDEADESGKVTRLACLPDNPARALYERHGFKTVADDGTFLHMERKAGA